jgi:acetyl esterase
MSESNKTGADRRSFIGLAAGAVGLLAADGAIAQIATPKPGETSAPVVPGEAAVPLGGDGLCLPGIPTAIDYNALRAKRMAEVDPEMRAIYDKAAATPSIRQIGIAGIRKFFRAPQSGVLPPGVTARNIEIPGPAGPIPTRVWMPEGAKEPVGVYLSTHGGGWIFGEGLDYHDAEEGRHVLDWGCAVVRPDYRIAPEHKFPAAIEDCHAVLQHIGEHGREMGLDNSRIGVGGGCAGANIGTVISLLARDAGEIMPAIQFLWSPACDMRNNYQSHVEFANGYGLRLDDADFASQNYLRSREDSWDWRASPVLVPSLKGAPPALVWVGEWEILHGETMAYVNRMRDAGVTVHLIEGPQQGHGFIYLYPNTRYSRGAMPEINRIMRGYIGPEAKGARPLAG